MEGSPLGKRLQQQARDLAAAARLYDEVGKNDADRAAHLPAIQSRLAKLSDGVAALRQGAELADALQAWLDRYRAEIETFQKDQVKRLGIELEHELAEIGLKLSGNYPTLSAGWYTIEIDPEKWQATLWYGPQQERLGTAALAAKEIRARLEKASGSLGSHLDEAGFLQRLKEALEQVRYQSDDGYAPIISVLGAMALLVQDKAFRRDPRRDNYHDYTRADFAADLCRYGRHVQLRTATRAFTRTRDTFLWVPSGDQTGAGSTYSHIRLRQEAP